MTDNFMDRMKQDQERAEIAARYIARKARKSVRQMNKELAESKRCEFCGEHGHKASDCPNKGN